MENSYIHSPTVLESEYQNFVKQIVDKYISMVSGEMPTSNFHGEMSDGPAKIPTKEELSEFYLQRSKDAVEWLNKNMVSYDVWLKNRTITYFGDEVPKGGDPFDFE